MVETTIGVGLAEDLPHLLTTNGLETMKILIAEDDRVARELLRHRLCGWGDEVVAVGDGTAAWDILRGPDSPRLAILDWMMPGIDGPEVCRGASPGCRRDPGCSPSGRSPVPRPYTYLLLVTAHSDVNDVVKGLESGADDYLLKPINPQELRARLQTGRRILGLQEELLRAQAELRVKATRDSLTGLWNRGTTLEFLTRELAVRGRTGVPVSVLLTDLDHFKRINDTHGHLTGDAVLREVAVRMQSVVRQTDWVGRYGGEEFLIVLPGCEPEMSITLGERVRQTLMAGPVEVADAALPVTASVGIAWSEPSRADDPNQLLRAADEALYRAKGAGATGSR